MISRRATLQTFVIFAMTVDDTDKTMLFLLIQLFLLYNTFALEAKLARSLFSRKNAGYCNKVACVFVWGGHLLSLTHLVLGLTQSGPRLVVKLKKI